MAAEEMGRILSLEGALADTQRSLIAHDFLLRGLLTHLAMTQPDAFNGLVEGLTRSGLFGKQAAVGDLTEEVAREITILLAEVVGKTVASPLDDDEFSFCS